MVFSSLPFIFLFLPTVFSLYFLVPKRLQNLYLLVWSLIFYTIGEGVYTLLLIATIALNWMFALAIARTSATRAASLVLTIGVSINLIVLIVFKYAAFLTDNVNALFGATVFSIPLIHLPIGVSFFVFQAISYLVDVARCDVSPDPNLVDYGTYKAFFPQLIAGPIVRYRDVRKDIHNRSVNIDDVATGMSRFVVGLGKKVLIADTLSHPVDQVMGLPVSELSCAAAWFGVVCFGLQIYFDFSGYSDMAIGMGRMFGLHFRENFDYPYVSRSIREFWRRWHISLSSWFRDYLYVPLGGSRHGRARTAGNLLVVFALCGMWHGANWNFVCWGLFHGALVSAESLGLGRILERLPVAAARLYVLTAVAFSWALFRAETLEKASSFWGAMIGFHHATAVTPWSQMLPNDVTCAVIVGAIGATGLAAAVCYNFEKFARSNVAGAIAWDGARLAALAVVWYASVVTLGATGFNPFIYFRF